MMHASELATEYIPVIRERLLQKEQDSAYLVAFANLKDPTISIILSIFLGYWGIDRFFIGDIGLGLAKLLTGGGCGIWWFIDIFLIMGATRRNNSKKMIQMLSY